MSHNSHGTVRYCCQAHVMDMLGYIPLGRSAIATMAGLAFSNLNQTVLRCRDLDCAPPMLDQEVYRQVPNVATCSTPLRLLASLLMRGNLSLPLAVIVHPDLRPVAKSSLLHQARLLQSEEVRFTDLHTSDIISGEVCRLDGTSSVAKLEPFVFPGFSIRGPTNRNALSQYDCV